MKGTADETQGQPVTFIIRIEDDDRLHFTYGGCVTIKDKRMACLAAYEDSLKGEDGADNLDLPETNICAILKGHIMVIENFDFY